MMTYRSPITTRIRLKSSAGKSATALPGVLNHPVAPSPTHRQISIPLLRLTGASHLLVYKPHNRDASDILFTEAARVTSGSDPAENQRSPARIASNYGRLAGTLRGYWHI